MTFPFADHQSISADMSTLTLEFDISHEMEFNDITFEKYEVVKLFERIKFSTHKLVGDWDVLSRSINLAKVWANIDTILFEDDKITVKLDVLSTPVGEFHRSLFNHPLVKKHEFFVSVMHEAGKNMQFLTINYNPVSPEATRGYW